MNTPVSVARRSLPIILLAAVVQGWSLYALHLSITHHAWPSTSPGALLALYAVVVFIPLLTQRLAVHAAQPLTWLMIGLIAVAFFYFGWFAGTQIEKGADPDWLGRAVTPVSLGFEMLLVFLLALPFLQSRLLTGRWTPEYRQLFTDAWHNKLTLAEAALFTGLFWGLLGLWQVLFHLLGIDYFRDLFKEPVFVYSVTALVFGIALHLIGSLEQWTRVVLEQLLSVLKWLAVVAGALLAMFTLTLLPKLPLLFSAGHRVLNASWLLWLVAVVVLFVNAAYRDGSSPQPYPERIGQGLRVVMPLLIIVAGVGAYALFVRTDTYGLTVERVWALVVAGFAILYSIGYAWAACRSGPWMHLIAPTNIIAAVALLIVLTLALTPLLSPYRLAADSQFRVARHWSGNFERGSSGISQVQLTPFHYLRFDAGAYGEARLRELAADTTLEPRLKDLAARALAQKTRWLPAAELDIGAELAHMPVYPAGRALSPELLQVIRNDKGDAGRQYAPAVAGLYVDLNGDAQDEFVLISQNHARLYIQEAGVWREAADFYSRGATDKSLLDALSARQVGTQVHSWPDLRIGQHLYRFTAPEK